MKTIQWKGYLFRPFGTMLIGALAMSLFISMRCSISETGPSQDFIILFGETDWYQTATAAEKELTGTLARHGAVIGPNTRVGLDFKFITPEMEYPVYTPEKQEVLERFVERKVVVVGKVVDLTAEGFGREIWINKLKMID